MLDWSPRIKLAMYTCDIQASSEYFGIDSCQLLMGGFSGCTWKSVWCSREAERKDYLRRDERGNCILHHSSDDTRSRVIRLCRW
jgi:hypothetical protein